MTTPKGYPTQEKEDRLKAEHVTVSPKGLLQHGLDVISHSFKRVKASDAVEANSTTTVINATAHVAAKGDVIRITSGALIYSEITVYSVTANSITLCEKLSAAPAAAVTFDVLKYASPVINSLGELVTTGGGGGGGAVSFTLDGASQVVTEDTAVPANNRPLPVKLTGFDGDVIINPANLNLEVQISHSGANFDSTRIGDGVDLLLINGDGSINANVAVVSSALPSGASTEATLATRASETTLGTRGTEATLATRSSEATLATRSSEATLASLSAKFSSLGQKNMANSAPVVLASDQAAIPVSFSSATSAATLQARGKIVGAALTGTYATLLTAGGDLRIIQLFNSCDQPILISLDGGTTGHFELDAQEQFSLDLAAAQRHVATGVVISAKHDGVAPASGSVRVSVIY